MALLAFAILLAPTHTTPVFAECADDAVKGVNWEGCRKRNLMLSGTDLRDANLQETNFTSTDMRGSQFDKADFHKAVLFRVAFDDSSAKGANFEKAIGYRVSFKKTDLSMAVFIKSEMQRVDFSGSTLTGADFSKAEVGRTIFDETVLGGNDFSFANVSRADFRKAIWSGPVKFGGAYFFQTLIAGVDLSKTTGLAQWQIDMACGDEKTVLPSGLQTPEAWPCTSE